ncbi:hypothetical protein FRX31_014693, partial [Thalictrum thalictroides]
MSLNANWWSPVAICRAESHNPNWAWVELKVKGIFSHAVFKYPSKREALVVLDSEEEVRHLSSLPILTSWDGSFTFNGWSPMAGALSKAELQEMGKKMTVCFKGIPYHLRSITVVERLAQACCSSWNLNEETINLSGNEARVTLFNADLEKIPRIIYLMETGQQYPVVVEITMTDDLVSAEKTDAHLVTAPGPAGPRLSVGESAVGETRDHGDYRSNESSGPPGFQRIPAQPYDLQVQIANPLGSVTPQALNILSPNRFQALQVHVEPEIVESPLQATQEPICEVEEIRPTQIQENDGLIRPINNVGRGRADRGPYRQRGRGRNAGQIIWENRHPWMHYKRRGQTRSASRGKGKALIHEPVSSDLQPLCDDFGSTPAHTVDGPLARPVLPPPIQT